MHPVPRGGFHKAGEGPAFGDSFPHFSSGRNGAQRSVPTGGAGLRLRHCSGKGDTESCARFLLRHKILCDTNF